MSNINLRLRHLRRTKNMSQEDLAQKLGISRQAIIAIEQGNSLPSLPVIMAILRVLDIPFHHLLDDDWSPFRTNNEAQSTDSSLSVYKEPSTRGNIPLQLIETPENLQIIADLPGVREKDVTIDLSQQHIVLLATRQTPVSSEDSVCHISQIYYGPLMRIISLPTPIDTARANAEFANGTVTLTLPKLMPKTTRRITFKEEANGPE